MSLPRLLTFFAVSLTPLAAGQETAAPPLPTEVATLPPPPTEVALPPLPTEVSNEKLSDMVRVWRCRFDNNEANGRPWDVNYDGWPDRWERVYDDDHPQYARIAIAEASPPGDCLRIEPDGASATAVSPPIGIMAKFSYKLRLKARLMHAEHGMACIRMVFYAGDRVTQVEKTAALKSNGEWVDLEIGDYQPTDPESDLLRIEVDFARGKEGDLKAAVEIADLRLYRLPSIRIHTDRQYNVYTSASDVEVTCNLSGISKQNPEIRFELFDATDRSIGEDGRLELNGRVISQSRTLASDIVDGFDTDKTSYEGETRWKPPIQGYGFYRVRVGMYNPETDQPIGDARSITLAVVPELEASERGEFGWTLPDADKPLPFTVLRDLLPSVGVRLVKLPVWFAPGDDQRADQLVRFAERLSANGIETIGMLQDPTLRMADPLTEEPAPPIEGLLSTDPSYWTPLIDHVITRLSLRIRWWQLGADDDSSFVGYDDLVESISQIRNQMFRFGQDIRLGLGWRWDHTRAWRQAPTWDFLQLSGREQLDAAGLQKAFEEAAPGVASRWVVVEPPKVDLSVPSGANPEDPDDPLMRAALVRRHQQRVRDFVEQILIAKINDADGIFVADPFSGSPEVSAPRTGVMNVDGTPGELLLPWRTCAHLLGGATHLGSITLPQGSQNWIFRQPDGQVVMVLWNLDAQGEEIDDTPIDEVLYLGDNVEVIDIWGGAKRPEQRQHRQVIPVGRMPRFVRGLNESVARWRMGVEFAETSLPSIFEAPHPNALSLVNYFPQGVGGSFRVVVPDRKAEDQALTEVASREWRVTSDDDRFRLAAGQSHRAPLNVKLDEATYGDQRVRVDFRVNDGREYQFSVWRDLRVHLEGVSLEVTSRLDPRGRLVVEQLMSKSEGLPVDFKCFLTVKGKRRKRSQVYQLGAEGDQKTYTYLNARELAGEEMRLRIEEIDGPRVIVHRFTVAPEPEPEPPAPDGSVAAAR